MINPEKVQGYEEILTASVRILAAAAVELIQRDPHSWSTRPCPTCRAVSSLLSVDFGCIRYVRERVTAG